MRRVFLALVIVALTLGSVVQPVRAGTFDLLVHNNTEDDVKIKLKGDETYSFTVGPGKIAKTVEKGTYEYSYIVCNGAVDVDGTISVTKSGVWLVIERCEAEKVPAKFVINSNIHETVTLSMSGPEEYEMTIGLGKNKFLDIVAGTYTYSHDYCDDPVVGTVRVTKNGKARLTLHGCERVEIISFGLPNPRNVRIGSHYAFPITITLIGPTQYYFTVEPGFNRFDFVGGTYTYIYTAYNKNYSGEIEVTGGGVHNTIIFSPLAPEP